MHYIYQLYPTDSRKKYYWSTADNDTRLKTRNITTETFAVYIKNNEDKKLASPKRFCNIVSLEKTVQFPFYEVKCPFTNGHARD